jgi:hypothetical protein
MRAGKVAAALRRYLSGEKTRSAGGSSPKILIQEGCTAEIDSPLEEAVSSEPVSEKPRNSIGAQRRLKCSRIAIPINALRAISLRIRTGKFLEACRELI